MKSIKKKLKDISSFRPILIMLLSFLVLVCEDIAIDILFGWRRETVWLTLIFLILFVLLLLLFFKMIYYPLSRLDQSLDSLGKIFYIRRDLFDPSDDFIDSLCNRLDQLEKIFESEHEEEIFRRRSELSMLQNNINPHFLYNTLEVIRGEAIIQKNMAVAEMTESLANFFRYNISKKGNFVTLQEELDSVANFFTIQRYRFNNRFSYDVVYHETGKEILSCLLPKLTLQPIVENAIFHGLETKLGKGKVTIHITATEKRIVIIVSDNGVGMAVQTLNSLNDSINSRQIEKQGAEDLSKHLGIALRNINQRLKLFCGEAYGITISSIFQVGTDVEITLPLLNKKDDIEREK